MENKLNHFDQKGNAVMVDVSGKIPTSRTAVAKGKICVCQAVMDAVKTGDCENRRCTWSSKSGWHYGGKTDISSDSDVSSADDLEVFGRF